MNNIKISKRSDWVNRVFWIQCLIVIIAFTLEIVMIPLLMQQNLFFTTFLNYARKYILFPTLTNISIVLISAFIIRKFCKNTVQESYAVILSFVAVCTIIAMVHKVFRNTLTIFCVPVLISAIFQNKKLPWFATGSGILGTTVVLFMRYRSAGENFSKDPYFLHEGFIAYGILILVGNLSSIIAHYMHEQNESMVKAIHEAERAKEKERIANNAKSDFLASMSHEIRTPLNAILGLNEIIMREASNHKVKEYSADIQQSCNVLLCIINDILDISKIESGRMEIVESEYELGSVINDSYNMVAERIKSKDLKAIVTCEPELPRILYGDKVRIRQIIINLLTNAVKYTESGSIEMDVAGEKNGEILRLSVKVTDTGIGMKPEDLKHLFDKFTRFDLEKNRSQEGTGLGMSITKQLIDLMHGTIDVKSTYGVGTTFTVRLPQKIIDSTPIGDIHKSYLDIHGEIQEYHKSFEAPDAHILVVDDVPINLQVICRLLFETKLKIDTAISGKKCLEMVCNQKYDIILMDHMMPEMDGIETMKEIKKLENSLNVNTPVIMLTANALTGVREEYLKAGFSDYLSKPVKGAKLEEMILRYLPKNKINPPDNNEKISSETDKNDTIENRIKKAVPDIDWQMGISYCADNEQFYIDMLKDFSNNNKTENINDFFQKKDWKNYRILAHSLKSSSMTVGLPKLSEKFKNLEFAVKEDNIPYINENHQSIINDYNSVLNTLKNNL